MIPRRETACSVCFAEPHIFFDVMELRDFSEMSRVCGVSCGKIRYPDQIWSGAM